MKYDTFGWVVYEFFQIIHYSDIRCFKEVETYKSNIHNKMLRYRQNKAYISRNLKLNKRLF